MNHKDKKLAVLQILLQVTEPITLADLNEKFSGEYSERSMRRWLAEMVKEGLVIKQGQKKGTKYLVAKPISPGKIDKIDQAKCFSSESIQIITKTRRPLYERTPSSYANEWFDSYLPNKTYYIPSNFREQLYKAGMRSRREDPAGTYAHQIYNRLLIDLSYNSSRLEGNTYSLLDTERLVLQGASAEGKLDEEKIMILNHKEAIRYLVDNAPRLNVNVQNICTLHYLLSDGLVEARDAGKVRNHGVRIGGSTYIPFEDPRRLQLQLERITEKAAQIQDPYEQSLFLLVHLSYLQAFSDVNKRTARLSANIPLVTSNLVPQSFSDVEREDYTSAMIAIYEMQEVRPLVDLYIYSYMRTCEMYDSTVKALGYDEVRVRYRQQRRALLTYIILNCLGGAAMKEYVTSQARDLIPKEDRAAFIEDTLQDLEEMDVIRITGLGITPEQLDVWKKNR